MPSLTRSSVCLKTPGNQGCLPVVIAASFAEFLVALHSCNMRGVQSAWVR